MDDTKPITKEEFDKKIKELDDIIKAMPPEKQLMLLKEFNAYMRELSSDLDKLDQSIKDINKLNELKNKISTIQ